MGGLAFVVAMTVPLLIGAVLSVLVFSPFSALAFLAVIAVMWWLFLRYG